MQRHRTLIALVVTGLALAVAPALAFAGVNQFVDTWTDEPTHFFSPNACVEHQAVGDGVESGTAWITETANGTVHVRGQIHGTVALYYAFGPPWDPQPGAYIGTWTYDGRFSEAALPNEAGSLTGTGQGPIVLADGHTAVLSSKFHLTFDTAGNPPKVFFANFTCSGVGSFKG